MQARTHRHACRAPRGPDFVAALAVARRVQRVRPPAPRPAWGCAPRLPIAGPCGQPGLRQPRQPGLAGRVLGPAAPSSGLVALLRPGAGRCSQPRAPDHPGADRSRARPKSSPPTSCGGLNAGGRTVAMVDAYNDPNAASDLNTYRQAYGLPACTTANGCFSRSTRAARPALCPPVTTAGRRRRASTSMRSRRPARPVTSCSSRPTRPGTVNLRRPRTRRRRSPAWGPSRTATAAPRPSELRETCTTTTRAWPSRRAPATRLRGQ